MSESTDGTGIGKKTVYAISSGDYSDYRVHALFESREDAEAAVQTADRWEAAEVQEFDFYPAGTGTSFRWRTPYEAVVKIAADGTIGEASVRKERGRFLDADWTGKVRDSHGLFERHRTRLPVTVYAQALTEEAAIKAASERAGQVAWEIGRRPSP